jgi:hypothetical protein
LKAKLGNNYFSSKENAFVSLWRTYNACQFVEDEGELSIHAMVSLYFVDAIFAGDILFYKGKDGKAVRK